MRVARVCSQIQAKRQCSLQNLASNLLVSLQTPNNKRAATATCCPMLPPSALKHHLPGVLWNATNPCSPQNGGGTPWVLLGRLVPRATTRRAPAEAGDVFRIRFTRTLPSSGADEKRLGQASGPMTRKFQPFWGLVCSPESRFGLESLVRTTRTSSHT